MTLVTKSLAEQVHDVLRERIVSGGVGPNRRLDLDQLATEFGVSMTPVRDAVRLLEKDGLVVIQPRKGVFTASADVKAFRDVFDARTALECLAVETAVHQIPAISLEELAATYAAAAERLNAADTPGEEEATLGPIDSALHDLIVHHCANAVVLELMDSLRSRTTWVRRLAAEKGHRYRQSFAEHRQVLDALLARDEKTATTLLRQHLTRSRDHTLAMLSGDPEWAPATGPQARL
jgi:DNA-binding GntR family transcriptional regulator